MKTTYHNGDSLRILWFNLLFSYRDGHSCYRIAVNLTVFRKHWCDSSTESRISPPNEYQQFLPMGKSGSLTCYLDFPDSCVLDSIKWYKVKKQTNQRATTAKNLYWCYFLLFYKTHFLFEGKLNPAGHTWYFVCLSQQVVVALIIILNLWLLLFCNTVLASLYPQLSIFQALLAIFSHSHWFV